MRRWVHLDDTPLTASSIKEYGSAVWNHWLAHRYGRSIVRSAWARAIHTRPGGFSVAAYESAIRAAGPSDFSLDFTRFSRDVAEWRTGRVFREGALYPDVPRQGSLPLSGRPLRRRLNHTTFELLRVHAARGAGGRRPRGRRPAGSPRGWRWSVGSAASATAGSSPGCASSPGAGR